MAKNLTSIMVRKFIPGRKTDSRKGQNGKILVVGGSYMYHGAPILASLAALRAGADLVYTAIPKINASATRAVSPNLIVIPMVDAKLTRGSANKLLGQVQSGLDSAVIGMGLAVADEIGLKVLIQQLSSQDVRLSLDASALISSILPDLPQKNIVLTPHAGEFERLFGVLPSNKIKERISIVEKYAKEHSVTILLKGPTDVISDGKQTYLNTKNLPSMTVGGTGDVLSGLVAAMLAKNRNPIESAASASFVNGIAGKLAQKKHGFHIVATDLVDNVSAAMKPLDKVIR